MSETQIKSAIAETGEVDLYKLFIKTILFFTNHAKIIFLAIAIGVIVGIGLYLLPKKSYSSAYLVAGTSLSKDDIFEVVKSLKYSVEQHDMNAVEKKLNLSNAYYDRILNIDIDNVLVPAGWDSDGKTISLIQSKLFKITVYFSRSSNKQSIQEQKAFLDSVKNGIINYINNNSYIKERQKFNKILLGNLIKEIGTQLTKLDTLQKSVIEQRPQRGQVVVENANKQSFSLDILTLFERKIRYEQDYQLDSPIMIVEDFNYSTVVEPRISGLKIIFICFSIFVLGLVYALAKEIKPLVQKELGKKQNITNDVI